MNAYKYTYMHAETCIRMKTHSHRCKYTQTDKQAQRNKYTEGHMQTNRHKQGRHTHVHIGHCIQVTVQVISFSLEHASALISQA